MKSYMNTNSIDLLGERISSRCFVKRFKALTQALQRVFHPTIIESSIIEIYILKLLRNEYGKAVHAHSYHCPGMAPPVLRWSGPEVGVVKCAKKKKAQYFTLELHKKQHHSTTETSKTQPSQKNLQKPCYMLSRIESPWLYYNEAKIRSTCYMLSRVESPWLY